MSSTERAVLRVGHRPQRDQRLTTHVGLTARAFGCDTVYLAAEDAKVRGTLEDVTERWGGDFSVETGVNWRSLVEGWEGPVVHLSMKGEPLLTHLEEVKSGEGFLAVVGAEKVPSDLYSLSDYNVSVTDQPHSEASALAVFLDRVTDGEALERDLEKNPL